MEETRLRGSVKGSVYWKYIRAGAGPIMIFFLVVTNLTTQLLYTGSDYWLSLWTNNEEHKARENKITVSLDHNGTEEYENITLRSSLIVDKNTNLIIYSWLVVALFILSLLRTVLFFVVCMKTSITLHDKMFRCITRAPMEFFDKTPIGNLVSFNMKDG